jgi:high-affinity nickel permease
MMVELQFLPLLGLGFLLGARHALDADHVAAVSALLSRHPDIRRSGLIGFCWGVGHTLMLLVVGALVLLLHVTIPDEVALTLEFGIGALLVWLGVSLALTLFRQGWHLHSHQHDGATHVHLHSHVRQRGQLRTDHDHPHWFGVSLRSMLVGMAHGLAGSAALMLVVLSTVSSLWQGLLYIMVFGVGSILGMMALGLLISLPLVLSAAWSQWAQITVQSLASLGSIVLGVVMMARIGSTQLPF